MEVKVDKFTDALKAMRDQDAWKFRLRERSGNLID